MPGFYMECYTQMKWVKREYSLPLILNFSLQKCPKETFLTRPKIQAKNPNHSEDCVLGEGQLYTLALRTKGYPYKGEGGVKFDTLCVFLKYVSSKERVKS